MSPSIPDLPSPAAAPLNTWVKPLAQGSFWLCLLMVVYFLGQAVVAAVLAPTALWQALVKLAWENQLDGSLLWMLAHPLATSLIAALLCLGSTLASWGLWRERRWGLWAFVWALGLSALANFVITWWLDVVMLQFIGLAANDAELQQQLQVQRLLMTLTLLGTSVLFAGLQGWLGWRLLRPDIRARFR
ncbi:hypothetical protein [Stenotrophomonas sp. ZAC14D2_NAIMI4_6]|uniref:hypothetical protein n=1 Tax=Stenotrophomonas sp. ZAC14D2_NAIMI4_6 TaxID=2072406 RepID=UPI000D541BFA|nr:hypothetical protein [Stenotrophomonas sp. ZAC14D2_NAIMI4_6]AWH23251.1 hypothetical protein C1933_19480 [Stenotrophomonas sp. ZAC14D2_NAIMI4_6]